MLLLVRSNSIVSDPRTGKYIDFFNVRHIDHKILGWDRLSENLRNVNTKYYRSKSGYNVGGLNAVIGRLRWMFFVWNFLKKNKNDFNIIHGCDLDGVFPAIMFKILLNRRVKVIFDVFDWYSDTLYNQNYFVRSVFKFMEWLSIKYTDELIICEPERMEQIPYKFNKKELILPNIPSFSNYDFLRGDSKYLFNNDKITISYVGGLYNERYLYELFNLAKSGKVNLLLAGYGDKALQDEANKLNELPNVQFFGKVPYKKGLNIMFNADIVYAAYASTNKNNIYAAPNKYYEAMLLGKPIISNTGTILSKKIERNKSGFLIDENVFDLNAFMEYLQVEDILEKGKAASHQWKNNFKTYTNDFLNSTYCKKINYENKK